MDVSAAMPTLVFALVEVSGRNSRPVVPSCTQPLADLLVSASAPKRDIRWRDERTEVCDIGDARRVGDTRPTLPSRSRTLTRLAFASGARS